MIIFVSMLVSNAENISISSTSYKNHCVICPVQCDNEIGIHYNFYCNIYWTKTLKRHAKVLTQFGFEITLEKQRAKVFKIGDIS